MFTQYQRQRRYQRPYHQLDLIGVARDFDLAFFQLIDVIVDALQIGQVGGAEILAACCLRDFLQQTFIEIAFLVNDLFAAEQAVLRSG